MGYRSLCFGQIGLAADDGNPFSLNRIAVKRAMEIGEFEALLRFIQNVIRRLRLHQKFRELARKILRPEVYLRMRKGIF